ncbi:hypothetical protein J2W28_001026 [Variovorax boronicumulans]|uniref:HNH endonuclease n=1 Tax=Variovorax boronicumulans TaxID=436515 RepID=UPI0027892223|nr:HNH endonuclease [Variovorax boronicumulans]MDP9991998.1 hypothetical protein [Variovorax boronicumulans]MDQ0001893.1 hypothetical protein [Variovorax boronicumulans]
MSARCLGTLAERIAFHSEAQSTGCVHWMGSLNNKGYGQIRFAGRLMLAHRAAYEAANGALTAAQQVLHRCDNPRCVNTEHLFLGTPALNSADKIAKGRHAHGERHGHAKLSTAQVLAIRASTEKQAVLAARFSVSQSAISRIRNARRRAGAEEFSR